MASPAEGGLAARGSRGAAQAQAAARGAGGGARARARRAAPPLPPRQWRRTWRPRRVFLWRQRLRLAPRPRCGSAAEGAAEAQEGFALLPHAEEAEAVSRHGKGACAVSYAPTRCWCHPRPHRLRSAERGWPGCRMARAPLARRWALLCHTTESFGVFRSPPRGRRVLRCAPPMTPLTGTFAPPAMWWRDSPRLRRSVCSSCARARRHFGSAQRARPRRRCQQCSRHPTPPRRARTTQVWRLWQRRRRMGRCLWGRACRGSRVGRPSGRE